MEIINMKICTYYFFNDMINIKNFDLNRIKIYQKYHYLLPRVYYY